MSRIWQTIRSYILWSYDRGSMQYDVMVTLILAFIFITPYWVNFKDKPIERLPHQTGVVVYSDGQSGFIYQIEASAITGDPASFESDVLRIIEPITGEVEITKYEPVRDATGKIVAYKVWATR
jgi:hypothetical protein